MDFSCYRSIYLYPSLTTHLGSGCRIPIRRWWWRNPPCYGGYRIYHMDSHCALHASELLRVRNLEFIEAAQALGFKNFRIILRHALPNALTSVLIAIAFGVASAILIESSLSFLRHWGRGRNRHMG